MMSLGNVTFQKEGRVGKETRIHRLVRKSHGASEGIGIRGGDVSDGPKGGHLSKWFRKENFSSDDKVQGETMEVRA